MARKVPLILILLLAGCQTDQDRIKQIAVAQVQAEARSIPDLPPTCTEPMGKVYPRRGEAWVVTQRRWEFLAENRNTASESCAAEWQAYREGLAKR